MLEHRASGTCPFELQLQCGPDFGNFALIFDDIFPDIVWGNHLGFTPIFGGRNHTFLQTNLENNLNHLIETCSIHSYSSG